MPPKAKRFPCLVFCMEQADRINVRRVSASERDLPTWLRKDTGSEAD